MPTIRIHNVQTGEIIDREMNAEELAKHEADLERYAAEKAEADAKEAARQAIFDRLGITADEAKLLLGL